MEVDRGTDVTSTKNPEDLVFSFTETDTLFLLTSNLEGYEVQKITTRIMEATTQIADSGETAVRRWMRVSVVVEAVSGVKRLRKFFWIPDGVVLDKIKTKFNEEESVLRILMPKSVRGVSGVGVEEVKEEEIGRGGHRIRTGPVADKVPEAENPRKNEQEMEQGKKDVPQHEPGQVKEASGETVTHPEDELTHQLNKTEVASTQEMEQGKTDVAQHEPGQVKEASDEIITHPEEELTHQLNKTEVASTQEMEQGKKDVPQHEPGQVNEASGETITHPEEELTHQLNKTEVASTQEMEQGKKDVPQHEPGQVKEASGETIIHPEEELTHQLTKTEVASTQEMKQGKKDVPQHEPGEVKEASGETITHPEEELTHQLNKTEVASTQETPAKEEADLEAKSRAAEEKSEATESTEVEPNLVTPACPVEEPSWCSVL